MSTSIKKIIKNPGLLFLTLGHRGFLNWMNDKTYLSIAFKIRMGKRLDLNDPQTYSEKLQWLKIYDRQPQYSEMVDKYKVKDYVASIIGQEYIIPTIGVWDKFEDIDFYIVGSGPDFDSLKENSQNVNNFIMLGEICEFSKFSDYDIFILCSDSEGLPMSAIEAAAAGLPVMLSNVGGCSEVIKETADGSSNGILFQNKEEDISEKLSIILENYNCFFSSAQELTYLYDLNVNVNKYISIIERS